MAENYKKETMKFLKQNRISMFGTVDKDKPVMRAMWIAYIDDDFTIWYATGTKSKKMKQIEKNPNVCISVNTEAEGVRIFGKAKSITDKKIKSEKWQESWSTFFKGVDDPEYALIRVKASKVEYSNYEKFGLVFKSVL